MKKTLIALASVAALGAAHADVTLYGVIDAGFGSSSMGLGSDVNNPSNSNILAVGTQAAANSVAGRTTSMTNGMVQASRWGLKGSEDLGSGMKGMFTLESALNIAGGTNPNDHLLLATQSQNATGAAGAGDSSLNGQMFDREASVGLAGDFGQVTVGFQLNLNGEAMGLNDPHSGGYISPMGTYGGLSGMGSSFTPRASNSIKYKYTMGTTQLNAFYAMGGANGNAGAGSQTGLQAIIQATPNLSVNLTASRMNDDVSFGGMTTAQAAGANTGVTGLVATYYNATEAIFGLIYQATPTLKLKAGYLTETQSNPSNAVADLANNQVLGVPIVQTVIGNQIGAGNTQNVINTNAYASNQTTTLAWVGFNYDLAANQHLNFGFYNKTAGAYTKNNVLSTTSSTATAAYGQSNTQIFALVYDYDLSKKSDIYVAANYQKFDTGNVWGNLAGDSISFFGAGYRMKF